MSSNITKLDNIFKVLYQDHSYFLTYPTISKSKKNRRTKNRIQLSTVFHYSREEEDAAASKIQQFLSSLRNRRIFQKLKYTIYSFMRENPLLVFKRIDPMYYSIFEKDKYTVIFRLAGETFPPHIVYKIFGRQYVISSYKFPIREVERNGMNNRITGNENESVHTHRKKDESWKLCYVYKHDKTTKRALNTKQYNTYRKNSNFITWIAEKYGC